MQTMNEYAQNTYNFAYFGERGDWLIAWTSSNYSETVVRANCIAIQRALSDGNFEVETFKGPLAGVYGEWILVDPANTVAVEIAESILAELEDYPVVDDEVLSELEYDESCESAYAACDIDREHALDAAPFIVSKSEDNGRGVGYSDEYWPTESDVFFGYLAYRRDARRCKACDGLADGITSFCDHCHPYSLAFDAHDRGEHDTNPNRGCPACVEARGGIDPQLWQTKDSLKW